ncbi:putative ATP-binding cassette transporter [Chitinophaga dinghuensis]|uniref:Putative ATP-binding cassette transporter n=1 Tax=Chitinophaga dinghuensis TaxID=1539050 RepID=A0A327VJB9_9BACT|nr:cyclic peptide export ABC transporter [Chitinophaga dinghuensis]RAJ72780.1 putative ATP-binding cassette transporter [Chitinophaga dinghuensis]
MRRIFKMVVPLMGRGGMLKYIILGILSGGCSFFFIKSVTKAVGLMMSGTFESQRTMYIAVFAGIIALFVLVRKTLSTAIIKLSQTLFWNLRKEVLMLVLKANYRQVSDRRLEVHAAIVSDVNVLTNASMSIIEFTTAMVLAAASLIYLASISVVLFLITLVVALGGAFIYHYNSRKNNQYFENGRKLENNFLESLNQILDGFKEIYMEPARGQFIFNEKVSRVSKDAYNNNTHAFTGFLNNQITGQVLFYTLISTIVTFFCVALRIPTAQTVSYIFTLLYLLNAIETIMVLLPGLMRARIAANHLMDLRQELANTKLDSRMPEKYITLEMFEQITVTDLQYQYKSTENGFTIGPVNLEFRKGETIFIYGGNGSGKTTFVHTVLGLIPPDAGTIRLNGELVDHSNYPEYRTLFAVVFSDFYLFSELSLPSNFNDRKWLYYLHLFELEGKVTLENGRLSTTALSMGQRKRLALIAALLEEKPILVIDEWAADQDPYFRRKFYTEIIPLLKREGISIIAITHDDRYYHCADKLYKMDYGHLLEEFSPVHETRIES